jgi:cyclic pyranopterin phosphate synthase
MLLDSHGRQIKDLRVSLTDRCNFRCFYCLPDGEPPLARKDTILTFEEIVEACRIFVKLGIEKIRLTGGEPLLRKDVELLIAKLSSFKAFGLKDLALTTNGHTFAERARELKKAGLDRVTISLDSLKKENFKDITGVDRLDDVLIAIDAAKAVGLDPIKVNAVIIRGRNDDEVADLAEFARENGVSMRFIEYMPLDSAHQWDRNLVVSGKEIREKIEERFPLEPESASRGSETAWNYRFADGARGGIGIIAPVTEMFCGACSRIRLTADGQIRTCLFSVEEHNLRDVLRGGMRKDNANIGSDIEDFIKSAVLKKEKSHTINETEFQPASRSMSFIGG